MKTFLKGLYLILKELISLPVLFIIIIILIPVVLIGLIQEKGGAKQTIFNHIAEPIFNKFIYLFKK